MGTGIPKHKPYPYCLYRWGFLYLRYLKFWVIIGFYWWTSPKRFSPIWLVVGSQTDCGWLKQGKGPETNIAPKDGWLEDDRFLLGWPIFRGYVCFRECNISYISLSCKMFQQAVFCFSWSWLWILEKSIHMNPYFKAAFVWCFFVLVDDGFGCTFFPHMFTTNSQLGPREPQFCLSQWGSAICPLYGGGSYRSP